MADRKQVHEFAVKWCDKFRDKNINVRDTAGMEEPEVGGEKR